MQTSNEEQSQYPEFLVPTDSLNLTWCGGTYANTLAAGHRLTAWQVARLCSSPRARHCTTCALNERHWLHARVTMKTNGEVTSGTTLLVVNNGTVWMWQSGMSRTQLLYLQEYSLTRECPSQWYYTTLIKNSINFFGANLNYHLKKECEGKS